MRILGIKVNNISLTGAVVEVGKFLHSQNGRIFTLVTPNPEIIVQAKEDKNLRRILNEADLAVPDGVGIIWANKFQKTLQPQLVSKSVNQPVSGSDNLELRDTDMADKPTHRSSDKLDFSEFSGEVVPGIKLMEELCRAAAGEGWIVGLYGGREGAAEEALDKLKNRYTGLKGWVREAPEIRVESLQNQTHVRTKLDREIDWVLNKIKKTKTRILFVGLGAPKQEYFIDMLKKTLQTQLVSKSDNQRLRDNNMAYNPTHRSSDKLKFSEFSGVVLMSVGGSFDEIAGRVWPAPVWISRLGLKWLWRLLQEPWRVKRQTRLVKYIWLVFKNEFTGFLDRRK